MAEVVQAAGLADASSAVLQQPRRMVEAPGGDERGGGGAEATAG
jgi:Arc/MetJ family transcription regulator